MSAVTVLTLSVLLPLCFFAAVPAAAEDAAKKGAEVPKLSVEEFDKKRQEKDAVVLDVRTPAEFKAGHVPGAVNLDINDKEFGKKVEQLDKDKTYLVHCAAGVRSARAVKLMRPTLDKLYDFNGGWRAWEKAGKPVEK